MPLSKSDRDLAEDEYRSLVHLSQYWCSDDIHVRFVRPLGFLREYNAIVTERFYARHFFRILRYLDLRRRLRKKGPDFGHKVMAGLGTALARFHQTAMKECEVDIESILRKMEGCCSQLKCFGLQPKFIDKVMSKVSKVRNLRMYSHQTNTLKGFDVRQVFVNDAGMAFLLDPGKMKMDHKEMDLARFIVTCRILYWGSTFLFLRLSPDTSYEESFVQAYYGNNKRQDKILRLLIIKELLKHWRMAYTVLELKQWPLVIKKVLRETYIDPFYRWQVNAEAAHLGE